MHIFLFLFKEIHKIFLNKFFEHNLHLINFKQKATNKNRLFKTFSSFISFKNSYARMKI